MKTAIIGSGNVGKALAGSFIRAGHGVTLSAAHAEHARVAAAATGARAAATAREAVAGADVVVLAVPYGALLDLVDELGDALRARSSSTPPTRCATTIRDSPSRARPRPSRCRPAPRAPRSSRPSTRRWPHARPNRPSPTCAATASWPATTNRPRPRCWSWWLRSASTLSTPAPSKSARALEGLALVNILLQLHNNGSWQTAWKLSAPELSGFRNA